jgi:hypothetical protein
MDLYYAIQNARIVALTWAPSLERARDLIELALAERGELDTEDLEIERFARREGPIVIDLEDY